MNFACLIDDAPVIQFQHKETNIEEIMDLFLMTQLWDNAQISKDGTFPMGLKTLCNRIHC